VNIKVKIIASYLVVITTIIFTVFYYNDFFKEEIIGCGTADPISICGNTLNENQKEGRKLFKSLCASCHKLDKKLIGPALGGIVMDSISFFNLTTKNYSINKTTYNHHFKQLTLENTNEILLYLKN
jgi:cytochrome c2